MDKGYCVKCKKLVKIDGPSMVKIRNRNSNTGTVDSISGNCEHCQGKVYVIVGKG